MLPESRTAGRHVLVDGLVDQEGAEKLRSVSWIYEMLRHLVDRLGMRMLGDPLIYRVDERPELLKQEHNDEGGLTGVCILSTSHVSIHTWPLRRRFCLDVFSCRDFDPLTVLSYLDQHLDGLNMRLVDITREWPEQ